MILFSIIQLVANGWRVVQWRCYVLWADLRLPPRRSDLVHLLWTIAVVPDKAMVYLAPRNDAIPGGALPSPFAHIEGRGGPVFHRHGDTSSRSSPASAACPRMSSSRRARLTARPRMPPRRSCNRQSHRARALFRFASGIHRSAACGLSAAGNSACHRGDFACSLRHRAHDRSRRTRAVDRAIMLLRSATGLPHSAARGCSGMRSAASLTLRLQALKTD